MTRKLRISAPDIPRLRDFIDPADVDLGCRPYALKKDGRVETYVMSSDEEFSRLTLRVGNNIRIEDLGEIPDAATRLRVVNQGNRFANGEVPRGLGKKE